MNTTAQTSTPNPFLLVKEELENELKSRRAKNDYYTYTQITNFGFKPTRFHEYLCKEVQKFIETETTNAYDILLLSVPPQHGKSTSITETLPSWYLGKNPTHSVIVAGYSGDFVQRFGRRNIDKIRTYGQTIFGQQYQLAQSPCNNNEFELDNHKGRALFAGILGGVTGNPGNLIIIDDPIKNRQEAYSETTREAIKNEYLYSVKSRFAAGAKLIVIATRWVEDDLIGWLEENEINVRVINIPCECVDPENDPLGRQAGDALMPEIGKGRSWLEQFKSSYLKQEGSTAWQALYQGRPVSSDGNLWLKDWWRYYDTPPERGRGVIALSVDATFKDGTDTDFCVLQMWQKINDDYYLLEQVRKRMGFVDTLAAIRILLERYPETSYTYIEDKANGAAIIDALAREFSGIIPVTPEGGKMARASAVSYLIETGHVHLPKYGSFLDEFIKETAAFPAGKHDDQVDAASQALTRLADVEAKYIHKKHRRYTEWRDDMWEDYDKAPPHLQIELLELWGWPKEWEN